MHSAISGKRQACSLKKLGLIIAIAAVFIIVLSVVKVLVVTFFFCRIRFSLNIFTVRGSHSLTNKGRMAVLDVLTRKL